MTMTSRMTWRIRIIGVAIATFLLSPNADATRLRQTSEGIVNGVELFPSSNWGPAKAVEKAALRLLEESSGDADKDGASVEMSAIVQASGVILCLLGICGCVVCGLHLAHGKRLSTGYKDLADHSLTNSSTDSPEMSETSSANRELNQRVQNFERRLQQHREELERRERGIMESTPSSSQGDTFDASSRGE